MIHIFIIYANKTLTTLQKIVEWYQLYDEQVRCEGGIWNFITGEE